MQSKKLFILLLTALAVGITAAGCTPQGPCEFTGTTDLTVYRLPDLSSDIFGTLPAGETHEVLARTAGGWIGFDPGVAQAGNTGLAHHRWIKLNATLSPICLSSVDEVTLVEVMAALPPTPPPPTTVPEDETADMEITNVVLSTNTVPVNDRVDVAVTVTNQGSLTATGYDIVLIPHYGWGPPNPGGYQAVPDLAPGASHTVAISRECSTATWEALLCGYC